MLRLVLRGSVSRELPVLWLQLGSFTWFSGNSSKPMFGGRRGGEERWYHYHEKLEEAPTRQQCLDWVSEQNVEGMHE